jgi:hypothetical protein
MALNAVLKHRRVPKLSENKLRFNLLQNRKELLFFAAIALDNFCCLFVERVLLHLGTPLLRLYTRFFRGFECGYFSRSPEKSFGRRMLR